MNNTKKLIALFIIALAMTLGVSVLAAFQPATLTDGINRIAVYTQEQADRYFGLGYALETKDNNLGAVPGPTITSNRLCVGGVCKYYISQTMKKATTSLCSFKNPLKATTTLESFTYKITVGTSTAAKLVVATSTLAHATTTTDVLLSDRTVASTAQDYMNWVQLGEKAVTNAYQVKPTEYVILNTAGAGLGGYTYTGNCTAIFREY